MRPLTLVLTATALAAVVALPQSALAACTMTTSTPLSTTIVAGRTYYIVDGCDGGTCPFAEFVYQEANNEHGLQRHDAGHDDTCGNPSLADIQIW